MSKKEIRIDRFSFPTRRAYDDADAFSFGHESCVLKFFFLTEQQNLLDFVMRQKAAGKETRLLTPFVPQSHLNGMKESIRSLLKMDCFRESVVIVNDLGMLRWLHQEEPQRELCLGRSFLFSFDYTPWGAKIMESEIPSVRDVVSQISFYDEEKEWFFRQFHVSELEVNYTAGTADSLRRIQKDGFRICAHASDFLYGVQRSCYFRRFGDGDGCLGTRCEQAVHLKLRQLWEVSGFYDKAAEIPFPETLYLRNNQICGNPTTRPAEWVDAIIE